MSPKASSKLHSTYTKVPKVESEYTAKRTVNDEFHLTPIELAIIGTIWKAIEACETSGTTPTSLHYHTKYLKKFHCLVIANLLQEINGVDEMMTTPIFSEYGSEKANTNYQVFVIIQVLSVIVHCLDINKKLPLQHLSRIAHINSRIYGMTDKSYEIIGNVLIDTIDGLLNTKELSKYKNIPDYQTIFIKFLSQFFDILLKLGKDPEILYQEIPKNMDNLEQVLEFIHYDFSKNPRYSPESITIRRNSFVSINGSAASSLLLYHNIQDLETNNDKDTCTDILISAIIDSTDDQLSEVEQTANSFSSKLKLPTSKSFTIFKSDTGEDITKDDCVIV